jgi:restriction system protein
MFSPYGRGFTPWLRQYGILALLVLLAAILIVFLYLQIRQLWLSQQVFSVCNVKGAEGGIRISRSRAADAIGSVDLAFPYWQFPKSDGTADLRRSSNKVMKPKSVLEVAGFSVKSKNPLTPYDLTLLMRDEGQSIGYCPLGSYKRQLVMKRVKARQCATSVQLIVASFSSHPTDFELFSADLYKRFNYLVFVTPPVNDGGFDLRLEKDGRTYIAECKSYNPSNRVGRPLLQKLAGANTAQQAQGLIFITTSSYTAQAVAYVNECGIQLIDGNALVQMCTQTWGSPLPQ